MGLDQFVVKVKKPLLNKRQYTSKELSSHGLNYVSVSNFESKISLYEELLPYVSKTNVECEFYDVDKMIADYNLPNDSYIWCRWGNGNIIMRGSTYKGERVDCHFSNAEVKEKYIYTKIEPYYCWEEEEVQYWRKNYDLQDWMYENIDGVNNCGYSVLDLDAISEINDLFDADLPAVKPTEARALFYHEWY